jgi:hypothetical protein
LACIFRNYFPAAFIDAYSLAALSAFFSNRTRSRFEEFLTGVRSRFQIAENTLSLHRWLKSVSALALAMKEVELHSACPSPERTRRRVRRAIGHRCGMNTILLVTSDDSLRRRISDALGAGVDLVRGNSECALPRALDSSAPLLVVDCRALQLTAALAELAKCRREMCGQERSDAMARCLDKPCIEVSKALRCADLELIFPETDREEDVIRVRIRNMAQAAAAATALDLLLRLMPAATHETLRIVLGSGSRVSSVKELAAHHHKDRTWISKKLRTLNYDWTSKQLVDLTRASHAAILLREGRSSLATVAKAVRLAKASSLDDLLKRVFDMRAKQVRDEFPDLGPGDWLELQLVAAVKRGGGRHRNL